VAVGPGLGTAEETGQLVRKLYQELIQPLVVDADGLNLLAGAVGVPAAGPRVLTPHPGEMSRLTGLSTLEIQADRRAVAADYAKRHNVYLVLKGAATVIAAPDGRLAVNSTGNPGMAAGGMGDVLTGLIGGLLAQGVAPWEASCLGVYVHGLAADRIVRAGRPFGFLAGELAAEIPAAFQEVLEYEGTMKKA
jgi:NAD(P)H-hydrate epimerase